MTWYETHRGLYCIVEGCPHPRGKEGPCNAHRSTQSGTGLLVPGDIGEARRAKHSERSEPGSEATGEDGIDLDDPSDEIGEQYQAYENDWGA